MASDEKLNVEGAIEKLNAALVLQNRSVLQLALCSASMAGFHHQAVAETLRGFADAELEDVRLLVEKVVAIGGDPTTDVAPLRYLSDAGQAVDWLVKSETETIEGLRAVIPETGKDGRSEALEHVLEHVIMRKQRQIDFLVRARG